MTVFTSRSKYDALLILFELVIFQNVDQICFFNVLWNKNELLLEPFDSESESFIVFVDLSAAKDVVFLFEIFAVEYFFWDMSIVI
tara:strand:+ start:345 stop:599 length:255 start_codon:yes stop_codon:yes gene_type:complete